MKTILVIFRKELKDTLRDKRTLISMIAIPLLLFPLLIGISSRVMRSQMQKAQEKTLRIALQTSGNAAAFKMLLLSAPKVSVTENLPADSARALVAVDSLDAFIVFASDFDQQVANLKPGTVTLYFKAAEQRSIEKQRVSALLNAYELSLRADRFRKLRIDESITLTMQIDEQNLASAREKIAEVLGGFLPYLFILFCFMGSMYPAIDLAAGEKERGTLETLLTSPANRMEILVGKFCVVVLTGIATAGISMLGLYVGVLQVKEIPPELLRTILDILRFRSVVMLLSLLLPLTIFFAAALLSLSIFAKSYKEAQSTISPMIIVVIVPVFIGIMPGMTLTPVTALIPILNVSMATKAIIAGTIKPLLLAEVYASLMALAGLSLWLCTKVFDREQTIFRGV
jgi:sodium transport system permease protein